MGFIIQGDGQRIAESFDGEPENAPLLVVDYHEPAVPYLVAIGAPLEFSTLPGALSVEKSYMVSGYQLTDDIDILAPADFEISTASGSSFGSSVTLLESGGIVPPTTIYVRFGRFSAGTSSGSLSHTSGGAGARNFAISGTAAIPFETASFQQNLAAYTGTVDTFLDATIPTSNHSTNTVLEVDSVPERHILLRFENVFGNGPSQIPLGATIESASLRIDVTAPSEEGAALHRMLQTWNDTDTWNTWGSGIDTNGLEAATISESGSDGSPEGTTSIDVMPDLQAWSDGDANHGWAWLRESGDDGWNFSSSEGGNPPKLTVAFTFGGAPDAEYDSDPVGGSTIDFADVQITVKSADAILNISNLGGADLTLSCSLGGANPGSFSHTACPPTLAPSVSVDITLNCTPGVINAHAATFDVVSNDADETNVSYNLSCNGIAPEIDPTPVAGSTLAFGDNAVGVASAGQSVLVENTGTTPLTLACAVSGAAPGSYNLTACPASIAASANVTVNCQPGSIGAQNASLDLSSNDADEAELSFGLTCNGTGAEFGSSPAAGANFDFGGVSVSTNSTISPIQGQQ